MSISIRRRTSDNSTTCRDSALCNAWAPEAPHICHIGGWYCLMTTEGDTEHYHAVICSKRPVAGKLHVFRPGVIDARRDHCVSLPARRQTMINFEVSLFMEFLAEKREAAGFIIYQAANHQYQAEQHLKEAGQVLTFLLLTTKQEGRCFMQGYHTATSSQVLATKVLPDDAVRVVIRLATRGQSYDFYTGYSVDRDRDPGAERMEPLYIGADRRPISLKEVGSMVSTMLGMYATANGEESTNAAAFDWFEVTPL